MSFASLLIQSATIQSKSLARTGYEVGETWNTVAADVPCRQNTHNTAKTQDGTIRINTDDDSFFFMPGVAVSRGDRLLIDAKVYDVVKVNKVRDSVAVHHLEVIGRLTDNN